ncbi:MAG: tail fiber protein [Burkholderiaceae bacterium]|nr:tail fiber protein [Burkholderiaceae bacterium]
MATIGQLVILANGANVDPSTGFMPCDWRILKISDYPALFEVIGHAFSPSYSDEHFHLPNTIPLPAGLQYPASYCICTNGTAPTAPAPTGVLGRIERFAFQPALPLPIGWSRPANQQAIPANYHPCDGSIFQIVDNEAFFSIIGFNFGGDGMNTFALPNVPTDPDFYWSMPHGGYCMDTGINGDDLYPDSAGGITLDDDYIGQIMLSGFGYGGYGFDRGNPINVFRCDGQVLNAAEWPNLYYVLTGNSGLIDKSTTFKIPKLNPISSLREAVYYIVADGLYPTEIS